LRAFGLARFITLFSGSLASSAFGVIGFELSDWELIGARLGEKVAEFFECFWIVCRWNLVLLCAEPKIGCFLKNL
jgi:hypothetical protein